MSQVYRSKVKLVDESETECLGKCLAESLPYPSIVYLRGNLGAGKTTLTRALLRALGHSGSVKSPTYTLVEPYEIREKNVFHFDLYRLADPEELEFLGIRDYLSKQALCIFEWPERGEGWLPSPDVIIDLEIKGTGREANLVSFSDTTSAVLKNIAGMGLSYIQD